MLETRDDAQDNRYLSEIEHPWICGSYCKECMVLREEIYSCNMMINQVLCSTVQRAEGV